MLAANSGWPVANTASCLRSSSAISWRVSSAKRTSCGVMGAIMGRCHTAISWICQPLADTSDQLCKPRRGRHDQLPRKAGKSEHQAGARMRGAIEAADGADDDAGLPRGGLDGEVGGSVLQIGNQMHALIGQRHVELARRAARQRLGQRIALLAIELAHAADMRGEMALLHELGCDDLLHRRGLAV